jgi:hypothetical protein
MTIKDETIKEIEIQVRIFKSRATYGESDDKRHDLIKADERKWMAKARKQLSWSDVKIGNVFNRDPRTVSDHVPKEQPKQKPDLKQEITQPPVEESQLQIVSVSTEPISESGSEAVFLTIENTSDKPISRVYGKIIESKSIPDDNGRYSLVEPIVPRQVNSAWRGGDCVEIIPAHRTRDLLIAEKLYEFPGFDIFFETNNGRKQVNMLGSLVLDLEIGTEDSDCGPQTVQIKLSRSVGQLAGEILTELNDKQWKLNLVKLFHDGQYVLAQLKKAWTNDPHCNTIEPVSAEMDFERWFAEVTKALNNTVFKKLWYEDVVVNPRKDLMPDYIDKAERTLSRFESIMKSAAQRGQDRPVAKGEMAQTDEFQKEPLLQIRDQSKESKLDRYEPLKQIVVEAQKRHLAKVRASLIEFIENFKEVELNYCNYYIDRHPIDEDMRRHLPDNYFWQKVLLFREKSDVAVTIYDDLYGEICSRAQSEIGTLDESDTGGIHITSKFMLTVIELAVNICLGQPDDYHRYEWIPTVSKQAFGGNFISVGIRSEKQHRKLVQDYAKDNRCEQLAVFVKELRHLRLDIQSRLRVCIEKEEYIHYVCPLCHG